MATRAAAIERCGPQDTYKDYSVCKNHQVRDILGGWLEQRCASPGEGDSLGCRDGERQDVVEGYVKRYDEVSKSLVIHRHGTLISG